MTVELFKDGDWMAIRTDCDDESDFVREFCNVLEELIDAERFKGDWLFQLEFWLPCFVNICCKLRGYKAEVIEQRVILSGRIPPVNASATYGPGIGVFVPRGEPARFEPKDEANDAPVF